MSDAATRCSRANGAEPLAGTAPTESRILILEQPGAWGRDAVSDSGLPAAVWSDCAPDGTRVMVARRADRAKTSSERHWWSLQVEGSTVTSRAGVIGWQDSLDDRVWHGPATTTDPIFLCSNGKRDACCAEFGRALLREFPDEDRLWECSHLGGHRFAPTALVLRTGEVLGRLSPTSLAAALAGHAPGADVLRGRVGRSPQRQVAEIIAHTQAGVPLGEVSSIQRGTDEVELTLRLADGRAATSRLRLQRQEGPARSVSCGREPEPAVFWQQLPSG